MHVVPQEIEKKSIGLSEQVERSVRHYLMNAKSNDDALHLYQLVLETVEITLFREVMKKAHYNQSKAVRILGLSRGCFRMKLKHYFGDEFITSRWW